MLAGMACQVEGNALLGVCIFAHDGLLLLFYKPRAKHTVPNLNCGINTEIGPKDLFEMTSNK